ncbi:MAG TPA: Rieske (2Fe-2S) protein [Stellaceae bacterium]|nr:Rieske (2Fe-2S) protein [Stellaceae bacterium]
MELPESIKAIGEQLDGGSEMAPAPELFEAYDVFAAELAQIFTQPWLAVDHASRLAADGDYLRVDFGSRSIVLVRENEENIHALRNSCLHAGYRVCEAESGRAEHLYCQYHGWFYALDGRLTDPLLRPNMADRSRFRLPRYAMQIKRGLILVDPSAVAPTPPEAGPVDLGIIPDDLGERKPTRAQYKTTWNWKRLRRLLWAAPELALGADSCDTVVELGPLSLVALRDGDAVLLRLVPRYPGQTDVELVQMPKPDAPAHAGNGADPIGEVLRDSGDGSTAAPLDRSFFQWYWPLMAPPAAA